MSHSNSVDEDQIVLDGLKRTLSLIDQNDSDKFDIIDALNYEISLLETKIKEIGSIN